MRVGLLLGGLLAVIGLGVALVQSGAGHASRQLVGWLGFDLHRKLFPEQDAAGPTYDETAKGPLALAALVGQLRAAWPGESLAVVHGAACDVATGLLHHRDIEVGSLTGGKFVPWPMSRWAAEEKIRREVMAMPGLLTDETDYVFRRKPDSGTRGAGAHWPRAVGRMVGWPAGIFRSRLVGARPGGISATAR